MRTVYFDYNATTPLDPQVREGMLPYLGQIWGNPSSVHHVGRQARALLDDARDRAAQTLGCKPSEVVFTSGGTESANLAIFGVARLLSTLYSIDESALPAIVLEYPPNRDLGDLGTPVAFELARRLRKAPRVIAQEIAGAFGSLEGIRQVAAWCRWMVESLRRGARSPSPTGGTKKRR